MTHRRVATFLPQLVQLHQLPVGDCWKNTIQLHILLISRGEQMLQRKWTIDQGNVACLSVWPGHGQAVARSGHPLSVSAVFHGLAFQSHCLRVCVCVSVCQRLLGSYAGGRVLAAAVILGRSLLLHCWGPSRWHRHTPTLEQQEKLSSHYNRMAHSLFVGKADETQGLCC